MRGHWYPNLHYGFMMLSKKSTILNIESNHSFQCHCSKPHYLLNHLVFEFVTSLFFHRQDGDNIGVASIVSNFLVPSTRGQLITWILAFYFSQKFQRKYSMATSLTFVVIEIENLKEPRSGLLGLNHVVVQEKSIVITNMWQWDHERYS